MMLYIALSLLAVAAPSAFAQGVATPTEGAGCGQPVTAAPPLEDQVTWQVYFVFQVDKQAKLAEGDTAPAYPPALVAGHVEGNVLASFVVDASGHAVVKTFHVIKTTNALFASAVCDHLPHMRAPLVR